MVRDPGLQGFGALPHGGRQIWRRAGFGLLQHQQCLRSQQQRRPFRAACGQLVEHGQGGLGVTLGHGHFGLQQNQHPFCGRFTHRGLGRFLLSLLDQVLRACMVLQQRRRQSARHQCANAVGQHGRRARTAQALQGLRAVVHQHPRAGLHGRVQHAGGRQGLAGQQGAAARFADAVHREWVAAQIRKTARVGQARCRVQLVEHGGHAGWGKAGGGQHAKANAVGLAFDIARKIQLGLDGRSLPRADGGVGRVDAVAAAGRKDAQQQGRQRHQRSPLLGRNAARDMALRNVREFVGQHRGQLVGRVGQRHQAQVNAHIAAWHGKGVDAAVAHQEGLKGKGAFDLGVDVAQLLRGFHQGCPQLLQVLEQHRVVQVLRVATAFAHDLLAQATFGADREVVRSRFAQRWQAHLGAGGRVDRKTTAGGDHGQRQSQKAAPRRKGVFVHAAEALDLLRGRGVAGVNRPGAGLGAAKCRCVPCLPECTLVALAGGYHDTAMFLTVNP